jgi:membrane protein
MLLPSLIPDIVPEQCKRIADRHGRIFEKRYLRRAKPFAGAKQLIEQFRRSDVKIILASSAQRSEVDHYAALLDIGRCLSGVVSAGRCRALETGCGHFRRRLADSSAYHGCRDRGDCGYAL